MHYVKGKATRITAPAHGGRQWREVDEYKQEAAKKWGLHQARQDRSYFQERIYTPRAADCPDFSSLGRAYWLDQRHS